MPKKKNTPIDITFDASPERPRISKMIIKNFRCIGAEPVTVDLNDIVVLVGTNNAGKSSILRAYELVMSDGSKASQMEIDDFPNGLVSQPAEIELETVVFNSSCPGDQWVTTTEAGEKVVRERWVWKEPGKPLRQGFDTTRQDWSEDGVPWGAPNIANARRPQPHRINAFDSPEKYASQIVELLTAVIMDRLKNSTGDGTSQNHYSELLNNIKILQKTLVNECKSEIENIERQLSSLLTDIFPGYRVSFDAKAETDLEKCLSLFKNSPQLRMGPESGFQSNIQNQGSGARRMLLWATLKTLSETKASLSARPNVLLLDEPEICLHPNAIREACRVLYDLPKTGNWQVMVTTHSPIFVDVSRDNTTIVRVERHSNGRVSGTTVFRPDKVQLSSDERELLKLLNIYDPYVAEFFFGGRIVIVEGDTEYSVFRQIVANNDLLRDVHIIRARGKATIAAVVKILNHFGSSYSVLHDADHPTVMRKGSTIVNPAWTTNSLIKNAFRLNPIGSSSRLVASMPNFEMAFFGESGHNDKPYNAICQLSQHPSVYDKCEKLLVALLDHTANVPAGAVDWSNIELAELENQVTQFFAHPTTLDAPSP